MAMGRYLVDAVLLEGRGAREVAAAHGVSKSWIYELIKRYRTGGYKALQPRTRRPRSCAHQTPPETIRAIVRAAPGTLEELQSQLDRFLHYYNDVRPHRSLHGRTPLQAYSARVKAQPAGDDRRVHFRVRQDKVDETGKVSLRYMSRLYKIGLGRTHKGRPVKLLIADEQIRVIDLDGQLIRELTLDPTRNYQP